MEPKTVRENHSSRRNRLNILIGGLLLIAVGLIVLGRNLGVVDDRLFRILISWQMLLVVIGVWSMFARHLINGVIFIGVGAFFLIPRISDAGADWIGTYWPLVFVLLGLILMIRLLRPARYSKGCRQEFDSETVTDTQDGFVDSHITLGSVRHIVLDPVFRGGRIKSTFSGTVIDLRRTSLEAPETYIDIDATFSGIELYIPSSWTVVEKVVPVMGAIDDKRFNPDADPGSGHKLILRGNLTCGGIEIKA